MHWVVHGALFILHSFLRCLPLFFLSGADLFPSQGSFQRQVQVVTSVQKTQKPLATTPSQWRAQMLLTPPGRRCLRQRHPIRIGTTTPFSLPSQTPQCAAYSATCRAPSGNGLCPFSGQRSARSTSRVRIRITLALQLAVLRERMTAHRDRS
jgi:hypothetical protein